MKWDIATIAVRNAFRSNPLTKNGAEIGAMWTNKNKTSRNVKVWARSNFNRRHFQMLSDHLYRIHPSLTAKYVKQDGPNPAYVRVIIPFELD